MRLFNLFKIAEDVDKLRNEFSLFVSSFNMAEMYVKELAQSCIDRGDEALEGVSVPDDIMFRLFGVDQEQLDRALQSLEIGDVSNVPVVLTAISQKANTNAISTSFPEIYDLIPFLGTKLEDYVEYIRTLKSYFEHVTSVLQTSIDALSDESIKILTQKFLTSKILNTGKSQEISLEQLKSENKGEDGDEPFSSPIENKPDPRALDLIETSVQAREGTYYVDVILDRVQSKIGDLSDSEKVNFINSIMKFSESIRLDIFNIVEKIRASEEKIQSGFVQINRLLVSLLINELLSLRSKGMITSTEFSTSRQVLSSLEPSSHDYMKQVYAHIEKNYKQLLTPQNYDKISEFFSLYGIVSRAATATMPQADVAEIQDKAITETISNSISQYKSAKDSIPLQNKDRIHEISKIIDSEAGKLGDFLFWRIYSNLPTVIRPSTQSGPVFSPPELDSPTINNNAIAVLSSLRKKNMVELNKYIYHGENPSSSRIEYRMGVFSKIADIISMSGFSLSDEFVKRQSVPHKLVLTSDMYGEPTTVPVDKLLFICSNLYDECRNIPLWVPGGVESDISAQDIYQKLMSIIDTLPYHTNTAIYGRGGKSSTTLFSLASNVLLDRIYTAKSEDEFLKYKDSLQKLLEIACPWVDYGILDEFYYDDKESIYDIVKELAAMPEVSDDYFLHSSEQLVLLSRSIIFIIKMYYNLSGLSPEENKSSITNLTVNGKHVLDIFVDNIVNRVVMKCREVPRTKGKIDDFLVSKDKYRFLFGVDKLSLLSSMYDSAGQVLSTYRNSGMVSSGDIAVDSRNARTYRGAIGHLASLISDSTGVLRGDVFDVSRLLFDKNGNIDTRILGNKARHVFDNIKSIINSASVIVDDIPSSSIYQYQNSKTILSLPIIKQMPIIRPGATVTVLDESGNEVASVVIRTATLNFGGNVVKAVITPPINGIRDGVKYSIRVEYTGLEPDENAYAMQKIYTGRHLQYVSSLKERYEELRKQVENIRDNMKFGRFSTDDLRKVINDLSNLRQSIKTVLSILPSVEELRRSYIGLVPSGEPMFSLLEKDTDEVRRSLINLSAKIGTFVNENISYVA